MFEPSSASRRRPMFAVSAAAHAALAAALFVPPLLATPAAPELDGYVRIDGVPVFMVDAPVREGRKDLLRRGKRKRSGCDGAASGQCRPSRERSCLAAFRSAPAGSGSRCAPRSDGRFPRSPHHRRIRRATRAGRRPYRRFRRSRIRLGRLRLRRLRGDFRKRSRRHAACRARVARDHVSRARASSAGRGRRPPRGDHRRRRLRARRARPSRREPAPRPGGRRGGTPVALSPGEHRRATRRRLSERRRDVLPPEPVRSDGGLQFTGEDIPRRRSRLRGGRRAFRATAAADADADASRTATSSLRPCRISRTRKAS